MTVLEQAPVSIPDVRPRSTRTDLRADVRVVVVRGALDASTIARVGEQLDEAMTGRPSQVVVDLSACPFVDASALAVLLEAHRRTSRAGGVLTLCGCSPRVLRLLSLTGLRRVFDLG